MEKYMNNIVQFPVEDLADYRNQYSFINRNTKIISEEGEDWSYPCIAFVTGPVIEIESPISFFNGMAGPNALTSKYSLHIAIFYISFWTCGH
jgi:hypothetical protein